MLIFRGLSFVLDWYPPQILARLKQDFLFFNIVRGAGEAVGINRSLGFGFPDCCLSNVSIFFGFQIIGK